MKNNKWLGRLTVVGILAVLFTTAVVLLDVNLKKLFTNKTTVLILFVFGTMTLIFWLMGLKNRGDRV